MATPYKPTDAVAATLGPIQSLLTHPKTVVIGTEYIGKTFLCQFPDGEVYFDSALELDTDGSAFATADRTGQRRTSIHDANGRNLDANTINYFVLPEDGIDQRNHIGDGDFGVVLYGTRKAYACFGDRGPANQLGEGSIALHRDLGFERAPGGRLINTGIDSGVVTIVFPRSGNGFGRTNGESAVNGEKQLQKLKETALAYEMKLLSGFKARTIALQVLKNEAALKIELSQWMDNMLDQTPAAPGKPEDGQDLVDDADGIDMLRYAPVTMASSGSNGSGTLQTVYADFKLAWTPAGRWYVQKVVFHLSPADQAVAYKAKVRASYP
jgi:hypothetical protein